MPKPPVNPDAIKQQIFSDVGYGKPPKQHQFQKGKSGNPRGRPKKKPPAAGHSPPGSPLLDAERYLTRKISIKDGAGNQMSSAHMAAIRMIEQGAAAGSVELRKKYYALTLEAERMAQERLIEDERFWTDYVRRYPSISAAIRVSDPLLAEWLPAPEDITRIPGKHAIYRGALTRAEAQDLEHLRQLRDALIVQVVSDIRHTSSPRKAPPVLPHDSVLPPLIGALNLLFPARIVLEGEYYWDEVERLSFYPGPRLARELSRVWAQWGSEPIRGLGSIPYEAIRAKVERHLKGSNKAA